MGYVLSGLDPVLRVEKEGAYETYHKYAGMDWNKRQDIPDDVIYYQYKNKYPHHGTGKWVNF